MKNEPERPTPTLAEFISAHPGIWNDQDVFDYAWDRAGGGPYDCCSNRAVAIMGSFLSGKQNVSPAWISGLMAKIGSASYSSGFLALVPYLTALSYHALHHQVA